MALFPNWNPENPHLVTAIDNGLKSLENADLSTDASKTAVKNIKALNALKKERISPNTVLTVASSAVLTISLVAFEKHHVITTKAPQVLGRLFK